MELPVDKLLIPLQKEAVLPEVKKRLGQKRRIKRNVDQSLKR